jgi:hypothetical protein
MKKLLLAVALVVASAAPALAGEYPNPPPGAFGTTQCSNGVCR